jgi:DNA adenine methylase
MAAALLDLASAAITKALADLPLGDAAISVAIELLSAEPIAVQARDVRVCKAEEIGEERYILGVVLEPDTVDSQGDIYTAETIRQTAYLFMEAYENIGLQHSGLINDKVKILESWIQRDSTLLNDQPIKAGTWMLAVRVLDDELWAKVKDGSITGFSIGGTGRRTPILQ